MQRVVEICPKRNENILAATAEVHLRYAWLDCDYKTRFVKEGIPNKKSFGVANINYSTVIHMWVKEWGLKFNDTSLYRKNCSE